MSQPNTIDSTETAAIDQIIVRAAIHPGIGVARIGDSKTEYFIGPETVTPPAHETYRDAAGAIKRQAARFRLYGYNAAGQVVRELTRTTPRSSGPRISRTARRSGTSSSTRSTSPRR